MIDRPVPWATSSIRMPRWPSSLPLEHTTTLVIQRLDLGVVVPLCVLSGVLLLRRRPWGHLLASVVALKMLTLGAAVRAIRKRQRAGGYARACIPMIVCSWEKIHAR